jgi:hypothetical protein
MCQALFFSAEQTRFKDHCPSLGTVAQHDNLSHLGGRDGEDHYMRPAQAKSSQDTNG